jgi:predicted O-methyltransferase YrrM
MEVEGLSMDTNIERLLSEYDARSAEEWRQAEALGPRAFANRDEMLLSVGRSTGELLNLLIKEAKATSILELGTSYGYSAVWLAEAARATGGRVVTLELGANKSQFAREKLASVGLDEYVDFKVGDALQLLDTLSGPFDFVLLDLWKELYVPCFDRFVDKLSTGAIVVADNMLFPEMARADAAAYRQRVRECGQFDTVLLPFGSGLELSRLRT